MVFLHLVDKMDASKQSPIDEKPAGYGRLRAALELAWIAVVDRALWLADGARALCRELSEHARALYWEVADRIAVLGTRGRVATAGGVALAAGIGVAALVIAVSGGSGAPARSEEAPVAIVKTAPPTTTTSTATPPPPAAKVATPEAPRREAPPAPTLHGAAPVFTPPKADAGTRVGKSKAVESVPPQTEEAIKRADAPAATAKIGATPAASASVAKADARPPTGEGKGAADASGVTRLDGPPAGPKAVTVARDFAGAFVAYETGGIDSGVRKTFGHTAIAALSHSLLKRPPRLPANVKVPRAKVVNVVPGPSQGKVFTVSVSLLRVGVTSELRLEMEQRKHDGWQVTNVLG